MAFLKLLEISASAKKASQEVHLGCITTLRDYIILWRVLVEELERIDDVRKGKLETDESYFGGLRKGEREKEAVDYASRDLKKEISLLHQDGGVVIQ